MALAKFCTEADDELIQAGCNVIVWGQETSEQLYEQYLRGLNKFNASKGVLFLVKHRGTDVGFISMGWSDSSKGYVIRFSYDSPDLAVLRIMGNKFIPHKPVILTTSRTKFLKAVVKLSNRLHRYVPGFTLYRPRENPSGMPDNS